MLVKKLCMYETCSSGVIGQRFIPVMNGQWEDMSPPIDIFIAGWNMPNRVMNMNATIPKARKVFFVENIAFSIPEPPNKSES